MWPVGQPFVIRMSLSSSLIFLIGCLSLELEMTWGILWFLINIKYIIIHQKKNNEIVDPI